jgi:hypothetical protein
LGTVRPRELMKSRPDDAGRSANGRRKACGSQGQLDQAPNGGGLFTGTATHLLDGELDEIERYRRCGFGHRSVSAFARAVAVSTPPRIMSSMATRSKRRSRTRGAKSTGPIGDSSRPSARPFLRFYHSEELHERTVLVLAALESAGDPTAHRDTLAELAVELTNSGLHYYFVKPLKVAKAGFILEQSASIGMAGVQQVMAAVIRNIIARMDGPQLLSVGNSLRQFMR